ncbi:MAG: hypothetical protein PHR56_01650 [Dehalococcoidales bacterium]|nr:hypothetical protein [Dehalococcoidales bacterium]
MKRKNVVKPRVPVEVKELITACPGCAAFETIWVRGKTLVPTRKFYQRRGKIYHRCGKRMPCLLFRAWSNADG